MIVIFAVNAYGRNGKGAEAIELFRQVSVDLIDRATCICVLNACSHSGLVHEAQDIFDNISVEFKDGLVYSTMVHNFHSFSYNHHLIQLMQVDALGRSSRFDEAQKLVQEYEQTHLPRVEMYSEFSLFDSRFSGLVFIRSSGHALGHTQCEEHDFGTRNFQSTDTHLPRCHQISRLGHRSSCQHLCIMRRLC